MGITGDISKTAGAMRLRRTARTMMPHLIRLQRLNRA
jgi:hypothetical protein